MAAGVCVTNKHRQRLRPIIAATSFAAAAWRRCSLQRPIGCCERPSNHVLAYKGKRGSANCHLSSDANMNHIQLKYIKGPIELTDLGGHKCRWNDGTRPRLPKLRTARRCPQRARTEFGLCELVDGYGQWESSSGQRPRTD